MFVKLANFSVSTSLSRSASSNTTTGALPPSSRCTRFTFDVPAFAAMILPVAVSPVTETSRTSGCFTSWSPISEPCPVTTFRTPGGRMSCESSATRRVVRGVISAGLRTDVFPAASAGPSFQMAIIRG